MNYLKHIKDITLKGTSGKQTIADNKDKLFVYVDSDFKERGADEKGKATKPIQASVYELAEDSTFAQMFPNPERMCLTQHQIVAFVETHKPLLSNWYTFFLFKSGGKFFVARVFVLGVGLSASVRRFSYGRVWCAGLGSRVMRPRLDTEALEPETLGTSDLDTLALRISALESFRENVEKVLKLS